MRLIPALALLLFPLTAHAALHTQIGAQVRTEAGVATYTEQQDQDVPIALPTNRYTCVRRAVMHTGDTVVLLITCMEGKRQAFVIGTACDTTEPSSNESTVSVNVSKTEKPQPVVFSLACRTVAGTVSL